MILSCADYGHPLFRCADAQELGETMYHERLAARLGLSNNVACKVSPLASSWDQKSELNYRHTILAT